MHFNPNNIGRSGNTALNEPNAKKKRRNLILALYGYKKGCLSDKTKQFL